MGGTHKGNNGDGRRVDDVAMGRFLLALKHGARVPAAAGEAGFSASALYRARARDAAFAAAWEEALEISAAPRLIAPASGRRLQLRRTRCLRFDEKRRDLFLAHFAGSCDVESAAERAGVSVPTVNRHRAKDPDFAAGFARALAQGYERLEADLLRQCLEAQRKLAAGILPAGEAPVEFDRAIKLLARWQRRDGGIGPKSRGQGKLKRWTFDEAMVALEKKLRALKIPIVGEDAAVASGGLGEADGDGRGGGMRP